MKYTGMVARVVWMSMVLAVRERDFTFQPASYDGLVPLEKKTAWDPDHDIWEP